MDTPTILLVDDDDKLRRLLSLRLESEGYKVMTAESGQQALRLLGESRPQLVLADLRMPGMDGMELLDRVQVQRPGLPFVMLTAHGGIPQAVTATKRGAAEFLTKPVDRDDLLKVLEQHIAPHPTVQPGEDWASGFITRSPRLRALLEDVKRVAKAESNVLIMGPSGSGKEVLARALHRASRRSQAPFVAVNCGAVPSELLESELFGHKKGAFTGAHNNHLGLFRAAEGGTVFLDEIGDMPADLQVKLLRVLQEREVRPVGEVRSIKVNVRVLSATHRILEDHVRQGRFREDLYYRLNVVGFRLPPLEDRREDIPVLVNAHLRTLQERGAPQRVYSPEAVEMLTAMSWPGNIRQLFNVVEQNVALSNSRVISAAFLRSCLGQSEAPPPIVAFDQARAEFTRNYLRQLLEMTRGNVSRAARLAERNRTDFYKLLSRHDIQPADFKRAGEMRPGA